jgi:hypothetical protein
LQQIPYFAAHTKNNSSVTFPTCGRSPSSSFSPPAEFGPFNNFCTLSPLAESWSAFRHPSHLRSLAFNSPLAELDHSIHQKIVLSPPVEGQIFFGISPPVDLTDSIAYWNFPTCEFPAISPLAEFGIINSSTSPLAEAENQHQLGFRFAITNY